MFKSIGVFGSSGVLGGNLYRYFAEYGYDVYGYDLHDTINTIQDTLETDIIFLCLPTPYVEGKKGYGLTAIRDTLEMIAAGKVVVIKSTVLPGTTDELQKEYPELNLLFCPEFLTEKYAWEDTIHPDTSIIGFTDQTYKYAREVLAILPEAQSEFIMPAAEAEMVKIARNNYFVNKIVFMNMLFDVCQAAGIDYEKVKDALGSDRRIRRSHMEIFHQGGRGGAGTCFTKDSPAFRDYAATYVSQAPEAVDFISHYVQINKNLIKESGKDTGRQYEQCSMFNYGERWIYRLTYG